MAMLLSTLLLLIVLLVFVINGKQRLKKQQNYINRYFFHKGIRKKVSEKYLKLSDPQLNLVFHALRDYFLICHQANKKMVAMPSRVVDDAWHEFILSTRFYSQFCEKAFGRFLHHTPSEAMTTPTLAQEGIKRAWRLACAQENINPKTPEKLPLLFSIDAMLGIEDGFFYQLDCKAGKGSHVYCASHIGCSSGCSGDSGSDSEGFFDGGSDSSCGSSCGGGGCGGD